MTDLRELITKWRERAELREFNGAEAESVGASALICDRDAKHYRERADELERALAAQPAPLINPESLLWAYVRRVVDGPDTMTPELRVEAMREALEEVGAKPAPIALREKLRSCEEALAAAERRVAELEAAQPATVPEGWRHRVVSVERTFQYDSVLNVHTPMLVVKFRSVDARVGYDAGGWKDRDELAALLAAAPSPDHSPGAGKMVAEAQAGADDDAVYATEGLPKQVNPEAWDAMFKPKPAEGDYECRAHACRRQAAEMQAEIDRLRKRAEGGAVYGIIDPDYARIFTVSRCIAWAEGYALMMHGSFTRDLDLIAVPWADRVCDPQHLVNRIVDAADLKLRDSDPFRKPHDRLVWTLRMPGFGDPRWVDFFGIADRARRQREGGGNGRRYVGGRGMQHGDVDAGTRASPCRHELFAGAPPAADAEALAKEVWTALDKQSCPGIYMQIAYETIVRRLAGGRGVMRGFGMTYDMRTGTMRNWYIDGEGAKRWVDNDALVDGLAGQHDNGGDASEVTSEGRNRKAGEGCRRTERAVWQCRKARTHPRRLAQTRRPLRPASRGAGAVAGAGSRRLGLSPGVEDLLHGPGALHRCPTPHAPRGIRRDRGRAAAEQARCWQGVAEGEAELRQLANEEIADLKRERDEARANDQLYRWLRDSAGKTTEYCPGNELAVWRIEFEAHRSAHDLDSAIDSAMGGSKTTVAEDVAAFRAIVDSIGGKDGE